jgi:anaerobic selenocysteine-containing dehydrogenase
MSDDWEKYMEEFKIDYRPSIMLNFGSNSVMTMGNAEQITENFLKKFTYVISFNIFQNEFTEAVADIVLPDASFLERDMPSATFPSTFNHPTGMDEWVWQIRQPVLEKPLYERRDFNEVMLELAKKLGIQDKYYEEINKLVPIRYGGELEEKYKLKPGNDYSWQDMGDMLIKDRFGEEYGLDALRKDGLIKWKAPIEDTYWRWFVPVRIPIYFEFFLDGGRKLTDLLKSYGREKMFGYDMKGIEEHFYTPLAQWNPCPSHTMKNPEFDLWGFCWRPSFHTQSSTQNNPWLDEISCADPFVYLIQLNEDTGKAKGFKDHDVVWIENAIGKRIKGPVKLVQGLHPQHVCIAGCHGHWARGTPVAKGKGQFFDDLTVVDEEHTDPLTQGQDACVKVKIYKAEVTS